MSAWTVIGHTEVGSGGGTDITFSSIPQTYTDLVVVCSIRDTSSVDAGGNPLVISLNGSTANFTNRILYGDGSSAASLNNFISGRMIGESAANASTASTFASTTFIIPNYTSSNNKSISSDSVNENNATTAYGLIAAGLWSNSAAITSITIGSNGSNLAQYSSATLYGILKGSSGGVSVS